MENKSLFDISWKVTEEEYRQDKALSYSILAKFERSGYNGLSKLFDKVESPSLTFGSAVDSIITGGIDEFNSRFIVLDIQLTDSGKSIANALYKLYGKQYSTFNSIPEDLVSQTAKDCDFWKADKWDKVRYREVLKTGDIGKYYQSLQESDKVILDTDTFCSVRNAVEALKTSSSTKNYFAADSPFDNVKRYYQLKFKDTLNGIDYRCMADLIIVNYETKMIYPIDLKTSSHKEWDFYKSFIDWSY